MNRQFDHVGLVTYEPQENESWVEESQCWVSNPRLHPQRIEYLRPKEKPEVDPSDVGLWKLWNFPHMAFRVDNLDEAIKGEEIILEPFDPGGFGRVAFIHKDGAVIEYMEYYDLNTWFGQPTPWRPPEPE